MTRIVAIYVNAANYGTFSWLEALKVNKLEYLIPQFRPIAKMSAFFDQISYQNIVIWISKSKLDQCGLL